MPLWLDMKVNHFEKVRVYFFPPLSLLTLSLSPPIFPLSVRRRPSLLFDPMKAVISSCSLWLSDTPHNRKLLMAHRD